MTRLKNFLFLGLALHISITHGQQVFENFYGGASGKFRLIELASGNVFTSVGYSNSVITGGTSLIAPNGSVVHTQTYFIDTVLAIQAIQRVNDNEFYFVTGYYKDSCSAIGSTTIP